MRSRINRLFICCCKIALAGVLAFVTLSLCCCFYSNKPLFLSCEDGATDSKYEANAPYFRMVEGLSYGRTNNDGYVDLRDFDEGTSVDVLVMGGSHMEAMEVPQRYCTASLLDAMLPEDVIYNIGMSGHYLPICASNLAAALQKYSPEKYVVVDTGDILFSRQELNEYLQDSRIPNRVNTSPLYMLLRRNHYIHLVVNQLQNIQKLGQQNDDDVVKELADDDLVSRALSKMAETVNSSREGVKLIIVYHPSPTLNRDDTKDGSILFPTTEDEEENFKDLCEKNGILFLNMRDRFQEEYNERHILPCGFYSTPVGSGHLNRYGHEMIAEELYALIQEEGL